MEPDELERYIALKDRCTDIANEIYPHYKDLYPGGVKEMTALDPELSDEARAVKIRWFEKVLERLLKLQSRIASSATSNVQPPVSGNVQPPVSHLQHSSSATTRAAPPFSPTPPVSMQTVPPPPHGFLVAWKNRSTGEKSTDRRQFWNFCIEETWRRGRLVHQKELVDAFDENEKNAGREIGTGHAACLQRRRGLSYYIVDVWTATGIRVAPDQQAIVRSLALYWNDHKDKLDTWMRDWVTKRQPAPDVSHPFPASRAFVQYIHEHHASDGRWPNHGEEMDLNFLHAAYTPDDIMARWTAATSGGHAGGGGWLGDGCSDDGTSYHGDEGVGGSSGGDDEDRRASAPAGSRPAMDEDVACGTEASGAPPPVVPVAATGAGVAPPPRLRRGLLSRSPWAAPPCQSRPRPRRGKFPSAFCR